MRSTISITCLFFFGFFVCRKAMGEILCTNKALNFPFSPRRGVCLWFDNEWCWLKPIPSLLLLVAPETSPLLALEGVYALCPLLLAFHTLEVRLPTCVAASHAKKNTKKMKVRLNSSWSSSEKNATIVTFWHKTNPFQ